ncbi:hypothetical protein DPMN_135513 [Dreissena polymorpha]|uniref:Uncharacterized protein n=1 Tax=Dreissena polymorpha TaxID=45954 RepID=A0A9D4G220_DREPO|nr:hypothetical protein DPMN_135513 [Dreissena polymorpha]
MFRNVACSLLLVLLSDLAVETCRMEDLGGCTPRGFSALSAPPDNGGTPKANGPDPKPKL